VDLSRGAHDHAYQLLAAEVRVTTTPPARNRVPVTVRSQHRRVPLRAVGVRTQRNTRKVDGQRSGASGRQEPESGERETPKARR